MEYYNGARILICDRDRSSATRSARHLWFNLEADRILEKAAPLIGHSHA
jgi:hypothetical protein